jgi:hypothetical protein
MIVPYIFVGLISKFLAKVETMDGMCVLVAHDFVLMAHKWLFETKKKGI